MNAIPLIDQSALSARGCFYVGGDYAQIDGKKVYAGQMFVEVYEPKQRLHPWPLLMLHGAGQTSMNWLQTPDGRMGWCDYFVSKGWRVVLAEQPSRGRSAYHPALEGPRGFHSLEIVRQRFTTDEGNWPQAKLHTQWPDNGADWDDPTVQQFTSAQVEYLLSNKRTQELVLPALKELLGILGPSVLLTHSQAGPFGWLLADACPELVKAIIACEPFGPPFSRDLSGNAVVNFGLTELPLHFEPPVSSPAELELEILPAPRSGLLDGWVPKTGSHTLPRFHGVPILLVVTEASYHAQYDHLFSELLTRFGVEHDFVRLEETGIRGNGHFLMLEKNNLEIADLFLRWLAEKEM